MEATLHAVTADETRAIGAAIAPILRPGDRVVLSGELGAGKTTFVQGVAKGLGATDHVASPTFTLVREYASGRIPIAHVDVYRLEQVQDVVDLALDEIADGDAVLVVEWGDAVEELLGDDRLHVELTLADPVRETRRIRIWTSGHTWHDRETELVAASSTWGPP